MAGLFLGLLLVDQSGAEQQTEVRVLLPDHPLRPLSGQGHGRDSAQAGLELRVHRLRGVQLRNQGRYV